MVWGLQLGCNFHSWEIELSFKPVTLSQKNCNRNCLNYHNEFDLSKMTVADLVKVIYFWHRFVYFWIFMSGQQI